MLESYKWDGWDGWDGMGRKSLKGVILRAPLCGANNNKKATYFGAKFQFRTKSLPLVLQSYPDNVRAWPVLSKNICKNIKDEKCNWQHEKEGKS